MRLRAGRKWRERRGGMEDRTAVGETVVGGRRGRAEGMSGREGEAMDGMGTGGADTGEVA